MKFKILSLSQNNLPCLRALLIFFALLACCANGAMYQVEVLAIETDKAEPDHVDGQHSGSCQDCPTEIMALPPAFMCFQEQRETQHRQRDIGEG